MSFINKYKSTSALLLLAGCSLQTAYGMNLMAVTIPVAQKAMFTMIPLVFQGTSKLADTNNPLGYTSKVKQKKQEGSQLLKPLSNEEQQEEQQSWIASMKKSFYERSEVLRDSKIKTLLNITMFLMTCYTLVELQRQVIINPNKETSLHFALSTIGFIYQIVNFSKAVTLAEPTFWLS